MKRVAAFLLFFSACTVCASAASPNWVEARSPHFIVMTDDNAKQAVKMADQFERMRAILHSLFPKANVDAPSPILVIAVKDRKGFQALEPEAYLAKGQLNLAGLFLPTPDKNYILLRLDGQQEHPLATVYHEYTHFMLRDAAEWLPLWMNEGMASFFQNTDIHDKDVDLGKPNADDILYLREKSLLPLPLLFAVDHSSPYYHDEQKGSIFYAQSWALMHYLQITDNKNHTHRLGDYADMLSQHQDPVTAATTAFGDLGKLRSALEWYISRGSFSYFRIAAPAVADPATFRVTPLTPLQADARRADFLAYNGRTRDAHALLDAVLQQEPENASACETMGYMAFREHDIPTARQWFSKAVKADSQSYLTHYYYAAMSMQQGVDDQTAAQIESSFKTAIQLNPAFAPPYDALAGLYAMRHDHLKEAHLLNVEADQRDPSNVEYRIHTAQILEESDREEDALRVLKNAMGIATTPEQKASVNRQIENLNQYRASRAAAEASNAAAGLASSAAAASAAAAPADTSATLPPHPAALSSGHNHEARGIIHAVHCALPAVLELQLQNTTKQLAFYTSNYYKIEYSAANYTPEGEIHPCSDLEGAKARILYADSAEKTAPGQILSIELSR